MGWASWPDSQTPVRRWTDCSRPAWRCRRSTRMRWPRRPTAQSFRNGHLGSCSSEIGARCRPDRDDLIDDAARLGTVGEVVDERVVDARTADALALAPIPELAGVKEGREVACALEQLWTATMR